MALKRNKNNDEKPISLGQVSQLPLRDRDIYPYLQKTLNLLKKISNEQNVFKAIEIILDETPDGKQAYNTYLRLANQGFNIELYNRNTNKRVKKYDAEMRDFCAKLGKNNSCGLDGLLDQLHGSSIARGGMACEVVVKEDLSDIEDVVLIDPATFKEYKYLPEKHRYAIYQQRDDGKMVDLYEGNFFFVPHQPKPGRPDGTLQFLPAVATMTQFYMLLSDSMRILNRIGYPRYDVAINREAIINSLPISERNTVAGQQAAFAREFKEVEENLRSIGKDSDIIHFDTVGVTTIGGGVNGSGIDIRAWFETLEPLIVNAFNMTPVLMGRLSSGSYSLGTVEFKIVTDTVDSMRRGSKRIVEDIINLWARVKGYPVYAVCTHNPIDWEVQKEKLEVELMKMQKARRAEEYCWISHDEAAADGYNAEKADSNDTKGMFEYLSKLLGATDTDTTTQTATEETTAQTTQKEDGNNA